MKKLLAAIVLTAALLSCTNVNQSLGGDFIATDQKYDFFSAEFDLAEICMKPVDSLSAYSSKRINFGAIRDDEYGLTRRGSVVTLVPVYQSYDFGRDPVFKRFRFTAMPDSVSVLDDSDINILQNVNVYALTEPLDPSKYFSRSEIKYDKKRITKGVPVVNGTDSLSFDFTKEYGSKYLTITDEDLKDFDQYTKKFPGIYITTEDPVGKGGRFNMFKQNILEIESSSSYLNRLDNFAVLYYSGIYDGERKDSSLMFYFSPLKFHNLDSLVEAKSTVEQYVFNVDYHESDGLAGKAEDKILIEGGSGLKPVILASEIRSLINNDITAHGGDPKTTLISKATIELPFEFPDDYRKMYLFPMVLSPTVKVTTDSTVAFAGLTDASVSSENQGDINRSLCCYAPDVTHHVQQIIRKEDSDISAYDIWLLIMRYIKTTTTNAEASEMAEYYQQLAYYSYYNQLYGGYGGYGGGYGGYGYGGGYGGYGYNNYYNYMMMAQYASASATSTSVSSELDRDLYYNCSLLGPASGDRRPKLKVTYALPKK